MNQSTQITLPALLLMSVKRPLIWWLDRQRKQSTRNVEVLQMQQKQLRAEERHEHERQVRLASRISQLARM